MIYFDNAATTLAQASGRAPGRTDGDADLRQPGPRRPRRPAMPRRGRGVCPAVKELAELFGLQDPARG